MTIIRGFRNVISFLTVIPVGSNHNSLRDAAHYMWLFPAAGAIIGFLAACAGYLSLYIFPQSIPPALALGVLLFLTGLHHFDGLLDFGDALMVQGEVEKRQEVMRSPNTGVGGFGLGIFVLLLTYLSLAEVANMFLAIIVAETLAKFSMVLGAYAGKPSHKGIGSAFTRSMGRNHSKFISSTLITLIIVLLLIGAKGVILMSISLMVSILILQISKRLLGGVSGDVFGAVNEVGRVVVLLTMVVI